MFKTNIEALHRAHQLKTGHMVGKTVYSCHSIAGQLQILPIGSTIGVLIPKIKYLDTFLPQLISILGEYNLQVHSFNCDINRLFIHPAIEQLDGGLLFSSVKFISLHNSTIDLAGFDISPNQYLIVDSYDFNDELTVYEFYKKVKK